MISVIVPVRNGMPWLDQQLRALAEQECHEPWEVVVADNNSTDESGSVAQEWVNRCHMMRLVDASEGQRSGRHTKCRGRRGEGRLIGLL